MIERKSKEEVLEYFGISQATLYRWIKRGWIASPIRLGRKSYWYAISLEKTESFLRRCSESNLTKKARVGN